jgi:hypothetical protein
MNSEITRSLFDIATGALFCFLLFYNRASAEVKCRSLTDLSKIVESSGGVSRPLTTRELDFARGLYVAQPNTPLNMPAGDSGVWIHADGHDLVIFTRHGEACEVMAIGPDGLRNFERLDVAAGDPS